MVACSVPDIQERRRTLFETSRSTSEFSRPLASSGYIFRQIGQNLAHRKGLSLNRARGFAVITDRAPLGAEVEAKVDPMLALRHE